MVNGLIDRYMHKSNMNILESYSSEMLVNALNIGYWKLEMQLQLRT